METADRHHFYLGTPPSSIRSKGSARKVWLLFGDSNLCLPNAVIGGAPKCGTSSAFTWLLQHPQVCGSKPKETCYLLDADDPLCQPDANWHTHGLEGYAAYFRH